MYLIWYIIFCLVLAFIMASLFGKKFENSVITGQLSLIVMLYIFYLLDILHPGVYAICLLIAVCSFYGLYKVIKERRIVDTIKLIARPAAVIYVILLCLIYYTVRSNTVNLIDELHLWAALPKILATQQGKLQLKEAMLLGYTDYVPGMPLYLYFLMRVNRAISEPLMYFGYAALGGAMLLPMCGKIENYRKWYTFPLISGIFYLLPLTFYNSLYNDYAIYYKSIHVDAILGIAVGYATWLFACKPWRSRYKTIQFALSLSFLVLVKSSGIVFAGILLASTFLYLFIYERNALRKKHIYCLGLPLILYILWQICLNTYATTDSVGYAVSDVINFQFAKEFMAALMTKSIMLPRTAELAKYCTFGTIALWLISLYFILWRLCREQVKEKRMTKWAFVTLVIQLIVFIFGLYGLCVGPFKSTLLSYGRYISTILTAFFVYWCFQFIHEFDAVAKGIRADGKKWAILIVLDFMVLVIFYPLYRPMAISYPQSALRDADKIEHIVNSHVGYSGNGAYDNAVMIVDKAYDSYSPDLHLYLQRRLYFDMIDEKIQINQKLYFDEEIVIQKEQDGELLLVTENGWPECDYVFWVNYVDDANKFVDLYKVISIENNVLCLQQIASQDVN